MFSKDRSQTSFQVLYSLSGEIGVRWGRVGHRFRQVELEAHRIRDIVSPVLVNLTWTRADLSTTSLRAR